MSDMLEIRNRINNTYTPNRPIQLEKFFSGRLVYLQQITDAVSQPGRHPIVFGDRGIGKTSLANVAMAVSRHMGFFPARDQCNTQSTFSVVMRTLLRQITLTGEATPAGFNTAPQKTTTTLSDDLGNEISIGDVVDRIRIFGDPPLLFVIDELDRAPQELNLTLSDLIKTISDFGLRTTILLVGVADSLTDLIQNHPSIERNIEQVPLPQMSSAEIVGIIALGEENCGLIFPEAVKEKIVELSQGFPYFAHMLCLHTALAAVSGGTLEVTMDHFRAGIMKSLESVDRTIRQAYSNAVTSSRETTFPDVLYAAAKAQTDEFGCFSPTAMTYVPAKRDGSQFNINALNYPLSKLSSVDRGEILKRVGKARRYRYRFANPMMRQYVLMREAAERGEI